MLTVIIPTLNCERSLVPTLSMLVPAAMTGFVREVIAADGGSNDATREVVDIAGCDLIASDEPTGGRLAAAAAAAKSPWLMFLRPGIVLDASWAEETARYLETATLSGVAERQAAVFRRSYAPDATRPVWREAIDVLRAAYGRAHPDRGLVIGKTLYASLGGHRDEPDAEEALLRRLGRRRLVSLRGAAMRVL